MAALFASTWGDPTSTKRVLLIHGLMSASIGWNRVAQGFASRGYFVTAPDLLGHGNARRGVHYTVAALADELRPLFAAGGGSDCPYQIIVGHSLGGLVASVLLPLLKSTRPIRVILVDPPLEQRTETIDHFKRPIMDSIRSPPSPEVFLKDYPLSTREDATLVSLSIQLCDPAAVEAILDQNNPWSFSENLRTAPDNVKLTVLAADPSKLSCVKEEDLASYPHVTTKTVRGASHGMPFEFPQVIVETALEGVVEPSD